MYENGFLDDRLRIFTPVEIRSFFRDDVAHGLQQPQKTIPPKYFYDEYGSLLFEEICQQPEYYLTRTEAAILKSHAAEMIEAAGDCAIIELGSGSSVKTRLLLDECQRRGYLTQYIPIDISASMLEAAARSLTTEYPRLRIEALAADYVTGLSALPSALRRLVLFLGSNLGNFSLAEQDQLFARLTTALHPGDFLLIGLDLRKPITIIEPAYNDAAGVTAAFNLNLLQRMNRELQADFNLSTFSHIAFYNREHHQIEMHLRSECDQQVTIRDLGLRTPFQQGETIHTEISRKFDLDNVTAHLSRFGFQLRRHWTDVRAWFAVCLFQFAHRGGNGR
jgi:L-histidine N-alpha-methyltransferase